MKPNFGIVVLAVAVLYPSGSWAQVSTDVKVVFLKGTTLTTANADGTNVQTLVNDDVYKTNSRWSPAGDKIVYDTPTNPGDPAENTHNLIVVTSAGQSLKSIPQDTGGGWAFSVDEIGWYSNNAIFVTGAVNHADKEYISLDLGPGQVLQDLEERTGEDVGFETCASNAQVAYPVDARDLSSSPTVTVQVNGRTVYTAQLPSDVWSYGLSSLHWSGDCSHLAFIESVGTTNTFVVLSGSTVEARVPIPASAGWPVTVVPLGNSFAILSGADGGEYSAATAALSYNTTTHALDSAPTVLQQLQQREAAENKVMQQLGGSSPDWYRPIR